MTEITLTTLLPFFWFIAIGCVTPGPNNIMLAASGMNFGWKKTLPHMLGIITGYAVLMFACMIGIGAVFELYPPLQIAMKIIGATYLVYLAYRIATAGKIKMDKNTPTESHPLTFLESLSFQFINPKAWVVTLASIAAFIPAGLSLWMLILIIITMVVFIALPCVNIWVVFGKLMARLFTSDKYRHAINIALAILLIATIPMMVL